MPRRITDAIYGAIASCSTSWQGVMSPCDISRPVFTISGFCIHYPTINTNTFPVSAFLVHRFVRIGVPLLVCLLRAYFVFGIKPVSFG